MNDFNQIGNFNASLEEKKNYLIEIRIKASDIVKYWSKCGQISNFCSSYLSLNCPNCKHVSNSISFILNELLENAVKYSYSKDDAVKILLAIDTYYIIVEVNNVINRKQYEAFYPIIRDIQNTNHANQKYFEKLGAVSRSQEESGVGLLSIINFFKGRISARFVEDNEMKNVETFIQVKINIKDL